MLLQQIVEKLDRELNRLYRLREIVAGLKQAAPLVFELPEQLPAEPAEASTVVKQAAKRVRRTFSDRAPVARRKIDSTKPQTALSGPIPPGPVVVPAAIVAERMASRKSVPSEPRPVEGSLGAMIRAALQQ